MTRRGAASTSGLRGRVWEVLQVGEDPETGRIDLDLVDTLLLVLILLNVLAAILETVRSLAVAYGPVFWAFEFFSVAAFTVEYVVRLWACVEDPRYGSPIAGRIRYAVSFYGIVDLLAVLPFYAVLTSPAVFAELQFAPMLKLMRFTRVLKIGRYSEALERLRSVWRTTKADLGVALVGVLMALVLASSVMYYVEYRAQPKVFSSIPAAMWWGISAFTTVGYGDMHPITPLGKFLGGVIQLAGIGLFALPAGILAAGYEEEKLRRRTGETRCHACGREFEDPDTPA